MNLNLLNLIALAALMAAVGLQVKTEDLVASSRKVAPILLGLSANYVVVPAITGLLLYGFHVSPLVSAGFLILAICPGAPVGPPLTQIARGNVPLSVGLMLLLAGLSAVVSPATMMFLFARLFPQEGLHVDYASIVKLLLVAQLLPLLLGLALCRFAPQLTEKIAKPVDKVAKLLFVAVLLIILATQFRAFALVRARGWIGILVLLMASAFAGWLCGGREAASRRALALTTATRNAGVGLVIVLANFPGTPAVAAVVVYTVVSICGGLLLAFSWRRLDDARERLARGVPGST